MPPTLRLKNKQTTKQPAGGPQGCAHFQPCVQKSAEALNGRDQRSSGF